MQLLVTGFSKLPKHGFSRPESTKKLSVPSSKQRDGSRITKLWEALEVQVVTLCCDTDTFQAKDLLLYQLFKFQKMTYHFPGSWLLMNFGQVEYRSVAYKAGPVKVP